MESPPKVTDLRFQDINMLGRFLDGNRMDNWNSLGKKIFKYDDEIVEKIDFMYYRYKEKEAPSW